MAALRGPAATRRSSRFSSPVTIARGTRETASNSNNAERAKEIPKTFLDQWVEPPVRAPAPSFEDHRGLERVGVLEHFQPLGQPPTQKFLQKLKLAPLRPGRSTPAQNEVTTPTNGVEDMSTVSPAEDNQRPRSAEENMRTNSVPPCRTRKENDDDYRPAGPPAPVIARPKMTPRNSVSIPPTPLPTGGYIYHGHYHPETIKQHVEAAVRRADIQNPELVPGLRRLCADCELDPALWAVLDSILNQSPTKEQYKIFHRYVRAGKKEYSRQSTPTATNTSLARVASQQNFTPSQHSMPATTHPAPVQQPISVQQFSPLSVQPPTMIQPLPALPFQEPHIQSVAQIPPSQGSLSHQQPVSSPQITVAPPVQPPLSMTEAKGGEDATATINGETYPTKAFQEGLRSLERTSQKRSESVSSSSSLSSAKSLDAETFAPTINEEAQINGTRAAAKSGSDQRPATANKSGGNKSRGPKIGLFSIFPNTNKTNARKQATSDVDELEISRRRQRLQQNQGFHEDYNSRFHSGQSSERGVLAPVPSRQAQNDSTSIPAPVIHPHNVFNLQTTLSSPVGALPTRDLGFRNGISKKRSRDEMDMDEEEIQTQGSSPGPLLVPPPPGAASVSRPGTPRDSQMPPAKKMKKSARVMVSPSKPQNGGITVGSTRAGHGRDSTVGSGVESSEEENNDYCAACGGNGQLLCCDGCPNSFHFSCLDPPMRGPPEGVWYCPRCVARQNHGPSEVNGILGRLITWTENIGLKAFTLPLEIREYFDGIRTGEEGEYEDVGLPRTQASDVKMNRAGFIEEPDYKKQRDAKGNVIFCYRCRLTPNGKRDIIPCDFCPYRWHLDCLDPPFAVPPRRRNGDKPNATWRCPLHIENDLRSLDNGEGSVLGRQPRHRVPKNPIPRDVSMTRGFRNNGVIEVELIKDDERIFEVEMLGTVFRLPERGIRLDFLDRVRRSRYEDAFARMQFADPTSTRNMSKNPPNGVPQTIPTSSAIQVDHGVLVSDACPRSNVVSNVAAANISLRAKTLREQQAVLSLQALAQQDQAVEKVSGNQIAELTDKLILGAGEDVLGLAEREEREQLDLLQRLISRRLSVLEGSGNEGSENGGNKVMVNGVNNGRGTENGSEIPVQGQGGRRNRSRNPRALKGGS